MTQRFESKTWSCSDLIAGASAVVDQMENIPTDVKVAKMQRDVLRDTDGLSIDELQRLLQDCPHSHDPHAVNYH